MGSSGLVQFQPDCIWLAGRYGSGAQLQQPRHGVEVPGCRGDFKLSLKVIVVVLRITVFRRIQDIRSPRYPRRSTWQ